MERKSKMAVRGVSLMGSLGLGLGGAYFVGVYLTFQPGWAAWAELFLRWGPPLVVVPFGLLVGHLYCRTQLGRWLLERGDAEAAVEYAEGRLSPGLWRSRREALTHRLVLARGYLCRQDYEQARETLTRGYAVPPSGPMGVEIHRWQMEVALRRADWGAVREAFEGFRDDKRGSEGARMWACLAEAAARVEDEATFEEAMGEARWQTDGDWRVDVAEAFGIERFGLEAGDCEAAMAGLEGAEEPAAVEVPGRAAELRGLRAALALGAGERERAERLFEEAEELPADRRAERFVHSVRRRLQGDGEQAGNGAASESEGVS